MRILPETLRGQLEFMESHLGPWSDHAGLNSNQIGVTIASVETLEVQTAAARAAYEAMLAAQQQARAATQAWHDAQRTMRDTGAGLIQAIKAHAAVVKNPNVYTLAQLPPAKTPTNSSSGPAPETPTNLQATLTNTGAIRLTWDASTAGGTAFEIYRKAPPPITPTTPPTPSANAATSSSAAARFVLIGVASGTRTFTDTSLPAGTSTLTPVLYHVRALRRGRASDPSAIIAVQFGEATPQTAGAGGGGGLKIAG